jgi:hypothetical protein
MYQYSEKDKEVLKSTYMIDRTLDTMLKADRAVINSIDVNDEWYALKMREYMLIFLSPYIQQDNPVESYNDLIEALKYPGTRYGFLKAGYAVFGHGATIILNEGNGWVELEIFGFQQFDNTVLDIGGRYDSIAFAVDDNLSLYLVDLAIQYLTGNIVNFLSGFLPPLVGIQALTIN